MLRLDTAWLPSRAIGRDAPEVAGRPLVGKHFPEQNGRSKPPGVDWGKSPLLKVPSGSSFMGVL
jgi:hypothetical protein